jgi:hypothetical protein
MTNDRALPLVLQRVGAVATAMRSAVRMLTTGLTSDFLNDVGPYQAMGWRKGWDSNPRGNGTPCRFSRPVP